MKVLPLLKGKEAVGIRSHIVLLSEALRAKGVKLYFAVMQNGPVTKKLKDRGF